MLLAPLLAERRVLAVRIPECEQDPERLVAADLWRQYHDAFAFGHSRVPPLIPQLENEVITGFEEGTATKLIAARWRRPHQEARRESPATAPQRSLYETRTTPAGRRRRSGDPRSLVAEGPPRHLHQCEAAAVGGQSEPREIHQLTLSHLRRNSAPAREVVDFMVRCSTTPGAPHGANGLRGDQQLRAPRCANAGVGGAPTVADYRPGCSTHSSRAASVLAADQPAARGGAMPSICGRTAKWRRGRVESMRSRADRHPQVIAAVATASRARHRVLRRVLAAIGQDERGDALSLRWCGG
jgi:hypothetical protein